MNKKWMFFLVFIAAAWLAMKVNFSTLVGAENQFFTVFQFFGPIAGTFLGPVFGVFTVLGAQVLDALVLGKAWTLVNVLRLLPMLFAVFYFARYGKKETLSQVMMVVVPLIAMALFITHPIGRQAWFFSLYWLIPVLAVILPDKMPGKLFFRSLGATFTAHAVGGIVWLYTVPMTAPQWIGLIPVVAYERLLFAGGIAASYVIMNTLLASVAEKAPELTVDKAYVATVWMKKPKA